MALAACTGLTFRCLGLLLTPGLSLATQFIIPFTLAGLTAGAIASNVSSLLNYYALTSPAKGVFVDGLSLKEYHADLAADLTEHNQALGTVVGQVGSK